VCVCLCVCVCVCLYTYEINLFIRVNLTGGPLNRLSLRFIKINLKGGPVGRLSVVCETSLLKWKAAQVGTRLASTFSGRTQLH